MPSAEPVCRAAPMLRAGSQGAATAGKGMPGQNGLALPLGRGCRALPPAAMAHGLRGSRPRGFSGKSVERPSGRGNEEEERAPSGRFDQKKEKKKVVWSFDSFVCHLKLLCQTG
jgi:hypothetical protein